eukprot:SAG31_NODE_5447_length_2532_cov_17.404439_4_plen_270_part_00
MLCISKADLVPAGVAARWRAYFSQEFPGLRVVILAAAPGGCQPKSGVRGIGWGLEQRDNAGGKHPISWRERAHQQQHDNENPQHNVSNDPQDQADRDDIMSSDEDTGDCGEEGEPEMISDELPGAQALLETIGTCRVCRAGQMVPAAVFIDPEAARPTLKTADNAAEMRSDLPPLELLQALTGSTAPLVVGLIGDPNMGKSTLINACFGKPMVSRSATPGHTKHFQTLQVSAALTLVDCPGVVFPKVLGAAGKGVTFLFLCNYSRNTGL